MTDTNPIDYVTDPETTLETPEATRHRDALEHFVATHDDQPDELVFIPRESDDVLTEWIVTDADAGLDLDDWR